MAKEVKGLNHTDCRNFIPVDVAKGICRVSGEKVLIDTDVCDKMVPMPKCKNCAGFVKGVNEDNIGVCTADKKEPWTYGELPAVTCEMYRAK